MRMRIPALLAVLLFLGGCAASVDPAMQARVTEWFGKQSSATYDASSAFLKPMAFAVGQYVVHGHTDGEDRSVVRTALVGKDGDAWIMELKSLSPSGESMMQFAVTGMQLAQESMNPDDLDIKWIKLRNEDGEVQTLDGPALSIMKGSYSKALTGIVIKYDAQLGTASVRVPAGTFNGCTKANSKVETFFGDYEAEAFAHPKVPLNGVVRSVSKDNGAVTELLEFGTDAKPSF